MLRFNGLAKLIEDYQDYERNQVDPRPCQHSTARSRLLDLLLESLRSLVGYLDCYIAKIRIIRVIIAISTLSRYYGRSTVLIVL